MPRDTERSFCDCGAHFCAAMGSATAPAYKKRFSRATRVRFGAVRVRFWVDLGSFWSRFSVDFGCFGAFARSIVFALVFRSIFGAFAIGFCDRFAVGLSIAVARFFVKVGSLETAKSSVLPRQERCFRKIDFVTCDAPRGQKCNENRARRYQNAFAKSMENLQKNDA